MTDPGMTPVAKIDQLKEQRDALKNTMWEVAELIGFDKGQKPNRGQLIARLKDRLKPYNDKFGSPVAVTSTLGVPPYKPSPPAYSPSIDTASKAKAIKEAAKLKRETLVEFDITAHRFGPCMYNDAWAKLQKRFPSTIDLKAGTHFFGDKNVAYRIVGYLPSKPAFGVACCPAWMLEDSSYMFKRGDLLTYRTEWVLKKLGGKDATRKLEQERVQHYSARYGVFPQAASATGFNLEVGGLMRQVRVVDINVHQHDRPIIIEEVVTNPLNPRGKRWNISTNRLNEARPDTLSFAAAAGPVVLKRERDGVSTADSDAMPPPKSAKAGEDSGLAQALKLHLEGAVENVKTVDPFEDDL